MSISDCHTPRASAGVLSRASRNNAREFTAKPRERGDFVMEATPSDVVREAANEDSKTAVETWGPEAFARRTRTKIHNFGAPLPPWEDKRARPTPAAKGIPKSINIILLGPTGSGKSSLIYTWWRALSGSVTGKDEFLQANVHDSFLRRLKVGWSAQDAEQRCRKISPSNASSATASNATSPATSNATSAGLPSPRPRPPEHSSAGRRNGQSQRGVGAGSRGNTIGTDGVGGLLSAVPRHGTATLDAFQLQAPNPHRGSGGITVHDTKGQQFFSPEEERFAEQMLQGKVKEGSTLDKQNLKYWFMVGNFGFFSTSSLAASPHVVVLVFDVTLRSFQQMLREREANELCQCYRKIIRRAGKQGHEVFAVLTHIDAYAPDDDSDADDDDATEREGNGEQCGEGSQEQFGNDATGDASGFDREADMPGIISLWREELAVALSGEGMAVLPPQNVFAVENYHKGSSAQNPVLDLASLECLESVMEAGGRYVDMRYQQQQEGCSIA